MKKSSKQNYREDQNNSYGKLVKTTEFEVMNSSKKHFLNTFDYISLITITLILSVYLLSYCEEISWQISSVGRLMLIKILPYYDWRPLKNRKCLINKIFSQKETKSEALNCNLCEDIFEVDVHRYLEEEILEERYINLDIPVILTQNVQNWPNNSKFIGELMQEDSFSKSYPCNLATNIFKGISDVGTVLSKQKYFDKFFIHFQNCENNGMRALRKYVFRPDVLPPIYSPTLYNWLIWSQNYNTTNYKQIELVEKVTVIGQLVGKTLFRLVPRKNCEYVCPYLNFFLQKGEILIFTSLWDLEYRPSEIGESVAVIMEFRD